MPSGVATDRCSSLFVMSVIIKLLLRREENDVCVFTHKASSQQGYASSPVSPGFTNTEPVSDFSLNEDVQQRF